MLFTRADDTGVTFHEERAPSREEVAGIAARVAKFAAAISRMLGYGGRTVSWPIADAIAAFGEEAVRYSGASNGRVRATRARGLGWAPKHTSLLHEIEQGS